MNPLSRPILVSLVFTCLFVIGLISFLNDYESGKAEMTYMFEFPQYVRISNEIDSKYKKYGLYAYSEGYLTEKARSMIFDGIPVLFIPGSGGSHKQCRSLASIALRKALKTGLRHHFDYFTVDLNNEMSGLYGALLNDQLEYVNASISTILNLYGKGAKAATNIILIGHSMGGVLAKSIISQLSNDSRLVPIVITLAAPLSRPVLYLDYAFHQFYTKMNANFAAPANTTFITLAGGFNDFLVPPHLTEDGDLHAVVTQVPKSWLSTDHLSIVWCKQLLLALSRALYDSISPKTKQLFSKPKILSVFHHHLIRHAGTEIIDAYKYEQHTTLTHDADWYVSIHRQYSVWMAKGTEDSKWYMVPLQMERDHEFLTLVGLDLPRADWVYACTAARNSAPHCRSGYHLTPLTEIAPSMRYKRRNLHVNLHDLQKNYTDVTHLVVKIPPTDDFVGLHFDVHNTEERKVTHNYGPSLIPFYETELIHATANKAVFYEIMLPKLTQLIQSYTLYLDETCTGQEHHATATLNVPWNHHALHKFYTDTLKESLTFKLYKAKPAHVDESASIRLMLDPTCRYRVSIQGCYDFGMFVRFYSPMMIAYLAAVILMTLMSQLLHIDKHERCSFGVTALKTIAKPYLLIPATKILSYVIDFTASWISDKVPPSDNTILADENMDVLLLPIILYLVCTGVVWIFFMALTISLIFFESTIHKLASHVFLKIFEEGSAWTNYVMTALDKVPGLIAGMLVAICYSSCGGLAICLAAGFYYLKLLQLSQNFIEDLVRKAAKYVIAQITEHVWKKVNARICNWWQRMRNQPEEAQVMGIEEISSRTEMHRFRRSASTSSSESTYFDLSDEEAAEQPTTFDIVQDGVQLRVDGEELIEILQRKFTKRDSQQENEAAAEQESILRDLNVAWIREVIENNEIFFHFTLFSIYLLVASLNIPSVLTWARNYKYNKSLESDPVLIPGLIMSSCSAVLWQIKIPRVDRRYYKVIAALIFVAAALTIVYGVISIYRISFILSIVVALVTAHQCLAPKKSPNEHRNYDRQDEDDTDDDNFEERVRRKWD